MPSRCINFLHIVLQTFRISLTSPTSLGCTRRPHSGQKTFILKRTTGAQRTKVLSVCLTEPHFDKTNQPLTLNKRNLPLHFPCQFEGNVPKNYIHETGKELFGDFFLTFGQFFFGFRFGRVFLLFSFILHWIFLDFLYFFVFFQLVFCVKLLVLISFFIFPCSPHHCGVLVFLLASRPSPASIARPVRHPPRLCHLISQLLISHRSSHTTHLTHTHAHTHHKTCLIHNSSHTQLILHTTHLTNRRSTQSALKELRRGLSPEWPRLLFVWQAQYTERPEGAAARIVAGVAPSVLRVAGAVHRAS